MIGLAIDLREGIIDRFRDPADPSVVGGDEHHHRGFLGIDPGQLLGQVRALQPDLLLGVVEAARWPCLQRRGSMADVVPLLPANDSATSHRRLPRFPGTAGHPRPSCQPSLPSARPRENTIAAARASVRDSVRLGRGHGRFPYTGTAGPTKIIAGTQLLVARRSCPLAATRFLSVATTVRSRRRTRPTLTCRGIGVLGQC